MTLPIHSELDLYSGRQVEGSPKKQVTPKKASDKLIEDIWISVLEYLPAKDLARCTSLNGSFSNIAKLPHLWKNLVHLDKYSLVTDLGPFVERNQLSWKEVYRSKQLSSMITKMLEKEGDKSLDDFIGDNNPEYADMSSPSSEVKRPLTRLGNQIFTICDSYNVKITKPGQAEPLILQGKAHPGLRLLQLYVDQDHLYVLRENGTIAKWDLEKRVQTATIRSFFSEGIRSLRQNEEIPSVKQFLIQDGYVVLNYQKNGEPHLEIIDANNPVETNIIKGTNVPLASHLVIHEGKLYLLSESGRARESLVYIWDLSKAENLGFFKIHTDSHLGISSMTIENDLLCASEMYGTSDFHGPKIHLINIKTGKPVKTFKLNDSINFLIKTVMVENLLIAFAEIQNDTSDSLTNTLYILQKAVLVIDLHSEEVIAWTQDLFEINPGKLDTELLTFLVEETQKALKINPVEEQNSVKEEPITLEQSLNRLPTEVRIPAEEEHKTADNPPPTQNKSKKNQCVIQ